MDSLTRLIGRETEVGASARALYRFAGDLRPTVVGALQVTCSDESERECVDAFRTEFAEHLLPNLKFGERAHFRTANLGGRYEWGAARIALDHYIGADARHGFHLMLVKINAHVCVEPAAPGLRFGRMRRYDTESVYCGALHALLDGAAMPFTADLREAMCCEGRDRVAVLRDDARVDPAQRSLFVALTSARLQARRALIEIQDERPARPTLFVVLPYVTLNRARKDTEILCGVYRADWREEDARIEYRGLGDDPAAYRMDYEPGTLRVEDDGVSAWRPARDHRQLVLAQWSERREVAPEQPEGVARRDVEAIVRDVDAMKHHDLEYARPMLKGLLHALALLDPVSAAVVLFGQGVAGIHHLHRMHRLSRRISGHDEARSVLAGLRERIDRLPRERAREVIDLLIAEHRR